MQRIHSPNRLEMKQYKEEVHMEHTKVYGYMRVSTKEQKEDRQLVALFKNIIGVEALTFEDIDEDTLRLKAKNPTGNAIVGIVTNIVSLNMDYELFGDELFVSLNGNSYHLSRE